MVRPVRFTFNTQTASSNSFQEQGAIADDTQEKALKEFDALVEKLRSKQINVIVIDDTIEPHTPDSIFPNNWISFHEDGYVGIYPMQAENRRAERRADILDELTKHFQIKEIIDYSASEKENKFLEGTGSMVLDRENRICYSCLSPRTHKDLLEKFCADFNYKLIAFTALAQNRSPIYHTNVVMCVASAFLVICMDCIPDPAEREKIRSSTNKEIIEISMDQLNLFAGNMLEVKNREGKNFLVMSEQAYKSLETSQTDAIQKYEEIIYAPLYTIEANGGGSARCMMAEVFLPRK